nr:hypothetical protein 1634Bnrm2_p046 [Cryptomonas sp.]
MVNTTSHISQFKSLFPNLRNQKNALFRIILLYKNLYFFRKRENLIFKKLNLYQSNRSSKFLYPIGKNISTIVIKIDIKIKFFIKKLIECYQKYTQIFFNTDILGKNPNISFNNRGKNWLFNLKFADHIKSWTSRLNQFHNMNKFNIKHKARKDNDIVVAENKFLISKSRQTITNEKIFFTKKFSKINKTYLNFDKYLYFFREKIDHSNDFHRNKILKYIVHEKLIGFGGELLPSSKTEKYDYIFLKNILS